MSPKTNVPAIDQYIAAVNAFDLERILATFAADAIVNDARREFVGIDEIRRWVAHEIVGDRVTMEVTEVISRGPETVVRARFDGSYDKTGLPPVLILTTYFVVRDEKISSMIVLFNRPNSEPARAQ
jgi:ketosteroid isomerase-like protein